jgi:hypothetical protein
VKTPFAKTSRPHVPLSEDRDPNWSTHAIDRALACAGVNDEARIMPTSHGTERTSRPMASVETADSRAAP